METNATMRRPTAEQLRQELERVQKKRNGPAVILRVFLFLLVVVLIAAITFFCLLSGYVIYGDSMSPTLEEGDMVLAIPKAVIHDGDIVAFKQEDRVLIKRAIAGPGDRVEVLPDGCVILNGAELSEPYAMFGENGIDDTSYPLEISSGSWFVLGDNRSTSVDSRSRILGLIDNSKMQGKVFIRVWPLTRWEVFDPDFPKELLETLK